MWCVILLLLMSGGLEHHAAAHAARPATKIPDHHAPGVQQAPARQLRQLGSGAIGLAGSLLNASLALGGGVIRGGVQPAGNGSSGRNSSASDVDDGGGAAEAGSDASEGESAAGSSSGAAIGRGGLTGVVEALLNGSAAAANMFAAKARQWSMARGDPIPDDQKVAYQYAPVPTVAKTTSSDATAAAAPGASSSDEAPAGSDAASAKQPAGATAAAPASTSAARAQQAAPAAPPLPPAFTANGSLTPAMAMAAQGAQQQPAMSGWVVCSWRLSNITDYDKMAEQWNAAPVSAMITQEAQLQPQQVEVLTTANVSLGLKFTGVSFGADAAKTVRALKAAFADLALGFDPEMIQVSPTQGDGDGGGGGSGSDNGTAGSAPAALRQGVQGEVLVPDALMASVGSAVAPDGGRRLLAPRGARRLLQAATAGSAAAGAAQQWGSDAFASYTSLSPSSVRMLIKALELNCGELAPGDPLPSNCSSVFRYNLGKAGVPLDAEGFHVTLIHNQSVTVNVHLAVGLTKGQVAGTTDERLVGWLGDPSNWRSLLTAAGLEGGPDASWLQRPVVIITDPSAIQSAQRVNVALAVGLAVPLGLCVAALTAALAALMLRNRRGAGAGAVAGASAAAAAGGGGGDGQQRTKVVSALTTRAGGAPPAKRRYLAPALPVSVAGVQPSIEELAAANLRGAGSAAGGASASASASAPASAGGSGALLADAPARGLPDGFAGATLGVPDAAGDLRPRLQSLGDSVTSAVRFEMEEHGSGVQEGENEGADEAGADVADDTVGAREQRRQLQQQQHAGAGAAPALLAPDGGGGDDGASLISRRTTASGSGSLGGASSGSLIGRARLESVDGPRRGSQVGADPWPGPVEQAAAGTPPDGPPVVMGASNPPRVGALRSPFAGGYNFAAISAAAAAGAPAAASGTRGTPGAAASPFAAGGGGGATVMVAADGTVVVTGLQESLALASGSGPASTSGMSGGGSARASGASGGGGGGGGGSGRTAV